MNMETTPVDIDALAARFLECTPLLPAELATQAGLHVERAEEMLRRWPGVFFDKQGRIQGYWGLAIAEMKHSSKWRERLGPQCANFSSSAALCRSLNLPHSCFRLRVPSLHDEHGDENPDDERGKHVYLAPPTYWRRNKRRPLPSPRAS